MVKKPVKPRIRAPDATRAKLLQAAFEEIYRRGFQAARLDTILARAGVTKGALYHHFSDKSALGEAVITEVVRGLLFERWSIDAMAKVAQDPLTALGKILRRRSAELSAREIELGCPLNNLAQEMSPLDERFRRHINATFDTWREAFARALSRGQSEGTVRRDVDPRKAASFIVAAIEGSFGLAKGAQSAGLLRSNLEMLSTFLESLRPVAHRRRHRSRTPRARP